MSVGTTLTASPDTPGLWTDAAWDGRTPATFAIVIGVSRYDGFEGGGSAVPRREPWIATMRSLGQLRVSALTAWRVFEWLRDGYRLDDAPLAWVRLLLAPQAGEVAIAPAMTGAAAVPTLAACSDAIRSWADAMAALDPAVAAASRALFFFSGHGIEVDQDSQMLLPADYLLGPAPDPDQSIGVDKLVKGLAALPVGDVMLVLDACRSDTEVLRELDEPTGSRILTAHKAVRANATQKRTVLYATAAGRSAFQHDDPARGLSMFGTALLEALEGHEEAFEPRGHKAVVPVGKAAPFMRRRVGELLRAVPGSVALAADMQQVQLSSRNAENAVLTELATPPLVTMSGPAGPHGIDPLEPILDGAGAVVRRPLAPIVHFFDGAAGPRAPQDRGQIWDTGHAWFGSEQITELWLDRTTVSIRDHAHVSLALSILGARRSTDRSVQRVRWQLAHDVKRDGAAWIEQVTVDGEHWGSLVPFAVDAPDLQYEVEARYRWVDHRARLVDWAATVAPGSRCGELAQAWSRVRAGDAGGGRVALAQVEAPAGDGVGVGDLLAAAILATTGQLDRHLIWLMGRTVHAATGEPTWSDFGVLLADVLARRARAGDADGWRRVVACLRDLRAEDVPVTAIAFSRGTALLREMLDDDVPLDPRDREALAGVARHWRSLKRWFRPGGLFTSFGGFAR